jgi:hypothetical protein
MEQIVNKQLSDKPGEVSAAIAKLPESCESAILSPQNGSITLGSEAPCAKTGCGAVKLNGGGDMSVVRKILKLNVSI